MLECFFNFNGLEVFSDVLNKNNYNHFYFSFLFISIKDMDNSLPKIQFKNMILTAEKP